MLNSLEFQTLQERIKKQDFKNQDETLKANIKLQEYFKALTQSVAIDTSLHREFYDITLRLAKIHSKLPPIPESQYSNYSILPYYSIAKEKYSNNSIAKEKYSNNSIAKKTIAVLLEGDVLNGLTRLINLYSDESQSQNSDAYNKFEIFSNHLGEKFSRFLEKSFSNLTLSTKQEKKTVLQLKEFVLNTDFDFFLKLLHARTISVHALSILSKIFKNYSISSSIDNIYAQQLIYASYKTNFKNLIEIKNLEKILELIEQHAYDPSFEDIKEGLRSLMGLSSRTPFKILNKINSPVHRQLYKQIVLSENIKNTVLKINSPQKVANFLKKVYEQTDGQIYDLIIQIFSKFRNVEYILSTDAFCEEKYDSLKKALTISVENFNSTETFHQILKFRSLTFKRSLHTTQEKVIEILKKLVPEKEFHELCKTQIINGVKYDEFIHFNIESAKSKKCEYSYLYSFMMSYIIKAFREVFHHDKNLKCALEKNDFFSKTTSYIKYSSESPEKQKKLIHSLIELLHCISEVKIEKQELVAKLAGFIGYDFRCIDGAISKVGEAIFTFKADGSIEYLICEFKKYEAIKLIKNLLNDAKNYRLHHDHYFFDGIVRIMNSIQEEGLLTEIMEVHVRNGFLLLISDELNIDVQYSIEDENAFKILESHLHKNTKEIFTNYVLKKLTQTSFVKNIAEDIYNRFSKHLILYLNAKTKKPYGQIRKHLCSLVKSLKSEVFELYFLRYRECYFFVWDENYEKAIMIKPNLKEIICDLLILDLNQRNIIEITPELKKLIESRLHQCNEVIYTEKKAFFYLPALKNSVMNSAALLRSGYTSIAKNNPDLKIDPSCMIHASRFHSDSDYTSKKFTQELTFFFFNYSIKEFKNKLDETLVKAAHCLHKINLNHIFFLSTRKEEDMQKYLEKYLALLESKIPIVPHLKKDDKFHKSIVKLLKHYMPLTLKAELYSHQDRQKKGDFLTQKLVIKILSEFKLLTKDYKDAFSIFEQELWNQFFFENKEQDIINAFIQPFNLAQSLFKIKLEFWFEKSGNKKEFQQIILQLKKFCTSIAHKISLHEFLEVLKTHAFIKAIYNCKEIIYQEQINILFEQKFFELSVRDNEQNKANQAILHFLKEVDFESELESKIFEVLCSDCICLNEKIVRFFKLVSKETISALVTKEQNFSIFKSSDQYTSLLSSEIATDICKLIKENNENSYKHLKELITISQEISYSSSYLYKINVDFVVHILFQGEKYHYARKASLFTLREIVNFDLDFVRKKFAHSLEKEEILRAFVLSIPELKSCNEFERERSTLAIKLADFADDEILKLMSQNTLHEIESSILQDKAYFDYFKDHSLKEMLKFEIRHLIESIDENSCNELKNFRNHVASFLSDIGLPKGKKILDDCLSKLDFSYMIEKDFISVHGEKCLVVASWYCVKFLKGDPYKQLKFAFLNLNSANLYIRQISHLILNECAISMQIITKLQLLKSSSIEKALDNTKVISNCKISTALNIITLILRQELLDIIFHINLYTLYELHSNLTKLKEVNQRAFSMALSSIFLDQKIILTNANSLSQFFNTMRKLTFFIQPESISKPKIFFQAISKIHNSLFLKEKALFLIYSLGGRDEVQSFILKLKTEDFTNILQAENNEVQTCYKLLTALRNPFQFKKIVVELRVKHMLGFQPTFIALELARLRTIIDLNLLYNTLYEMIQNNTFYYYPREGALVGKFLAYLGNCTQPIVYNETLYLFEQWDKLQSAPKLCNVINSTLNVSFYLLQPLNSLHVRTIDTIFEAALRNIFTQQYSTPLVTWIAGGNISNFLSYLRYVLQQTENGILIYTSNNEETNKVIENIQEQLLFRKNTFTIQNSVAMDI